MQERGCLVAKLGHRNAGTYCTLHDEVDPHQYSPMKEWNLKQGHHKRTLKTGLQGDQTGPEENVHMDTSDEGGDMPLWSWYLSEPSAKQHQFHDDGTSLGYMMFATRSQAMHPGAPGTGLRLCCAPCIPDLTQ